MTASRIPSVEGGIQPTLLTAKGDLLTASATSTVTNLPVGADGQTLVANSASASGLQWQSVLSPYAAGKNPVLTAAMQVWQRGTSIAVAAATVPYTADRWQIQTGASVASTVSRQATADTTNLPNIQYCARVQRNSGQTGTAGIAFAQNFESINSIPFSGKTVTFSFYARAGANYSAASNALAVYVISGTGTDQNVFVGGITGQSNFIASSATLTTTWQRFTFTGTVSATATQLIADLIYTPVGTAGTNDYYEITGVQLEVGSVATPFHTFSTTIQGELAACQRYYWRQTAPEGTTPFGSGAAYASTGMGATIKLPVTMRTKPSSIDFSALAVSDIANAGINITTVAFASSENGLDSFILNITGGTGMTQYRYYNLVAQSTASYLGFSAEL